MKAKKLLSLFVGLIVLVALASGCEKKSDLEKSADKAGKDASKAIDGALNN